MQNKRAQVGRGFFWASVRTPGRGELHRTGWLTPYTLEVLAQDALRGGPRTRIEVAVANDSSGLELSWVHARLSWLASCGIRVHVQRAAHADKFGPPCQEARTAPVD